MNCKARFFFGFVLLLTLAPAAFAAKTISLITVGPWNTLIEAFGHSIVQINDSDTPDFVEMFEYGGIEEGRLLHSPDVEATIGMLFESKIPARVVHYQRLPLDTTTGLSIRTRTMYLMGHPGREVRLDELALTNAQVQAVIAGLNKDASLGAYLYDNFTNNCATRIRDILFSDAVLGSSHRESFLVKTTTVKKEDGTDETSTSPLTVPTSLQQLALDSVDEGTKKSPDGKVKLLPPSVLANNMLAAAALGQAANYGIHTEFASSKEMMATANTLRTMMAGDPMAPKFESFFFRPEVTANPVEDYKSRFTPARLRDALVDARAGVIDATKTKLFTGPAPVVQTPPVVQTQPVKKSETASPAATQATGSSPSKKPTQSQSSAAQKK